MINLTVLFYVFWFFSHTILKLVNWMEKVFRLVSGLDNISAMGGSTIDNDLLNFVLKDGYVTATFWFFFIFAIGLLFIFAIVAVIKNAISKKGDMTAVLSRFAAAFFSMILVYLVVIIGLQIVTELLRTIDGSLSYITGTDANNTIARRIMDLCTTEYNTVGGRHLTSGDYYMELFDNNDGSVLSLTPFGTPHYFNLLGIKIATSLNKDGVTTTEHFSSLISTITSIILLISLGLISYQLMRRIFKIAFLFVIMPMSLSTMPLDDGQAFKSWKDNFIQQVLLVFGAVIGYNVFFMVTASILSIEFFDTSTFWGKQENKVFYVLIILAGSSLIMAGMQMFNKVFTGHSTVVSSGVGAVIGAAGGAMGSMMMNMRMGSAKIGHNWQKTKQGFGWGKGNKNPAPNPGGGGAGGGAGGSAGGKNKFSGWTGLLGTAGGIAGAVGTMGLGMITAGAGLSGAYRDE